MADGDFHVPKGLFETSWIVPNAILGKLPGGWNETNLTAVAHRIQDGILKTAARDISFPNDPSERFFGLSKGFYIGWPYLADPGFWTHGDTEMWNRDASGRGHSLRARAYGIRIDPNDLASAFPLFFKHLAGASVITPQVFVDVPKPQPAPTRKPAPAKRIITDASLLAWYEAWASQNSDAVQRVAKAAAERHFKGQKVGRNQMYRVMTAFHGKLSRGNPAIYRK